MRGRESKTSHHQAEDNDAREIESLVEELCSPVHDGRF
jgi:hypothetical protein